MLPERHHDISRLEAIFTPMPFPVFSGFTYFLMGPAHWAFGVASGRRRKALEGNPAAAGV